jgi:hypothetical protein
MYKPTPQDIETIKLLAQALPPVQRHVSRKLLGSALQDLGYVSWNHKPIVPTQIYEVNTILCANLVQVIIRIVEREGMDVVNDVVNQLRTGRPMITSMGTVMFTTAAVRA